MNIMRVLLIIGLISCWNKAGFPLAQKFAKRAEQLAAQDRKPPTPPHIDNDLIEAAKHGNLAVVQQCLHFNPNANIQMPLASAAALGYPEIIDALITANQDQLTQDQLIEALGIAAQYGRTDIVERLAPLVNREKTTLFKKAKKLFSSSEPPIKAVTPLMYACEYQHSQVVDTLLNSQESTEKFTINDCDSTDMTALMWACKTAYTEPDQEGIPDIVEQLIKAKADVNKRDATGWTALMYAVEKNCLGAVNVLLRAPNINVNLESVEDGNALTIASSIKQKLSKPEDARKNDVVNAVIDALTKKGATSSLKKGREKPAKQPEQPIKDNDLMEAAQHGNLAVIQQCLFSNPSVNIQAPLASAAMYGYPEIIAELIKKANQDQLIIALGIAAQYGRTDIVERLAPLVNREKTTPFKKAKKFFSGSKPSIKAVTPLMYACKYQHSQVVETLLNGQVSTEIFTINYYDSTDMTALMWACKTAYNGPDQEAMAKIVPQLIKAGADVNRQDRTGFTALMYAVSRNCLEAVQQLLAAGAKVDLTSSEGTTALVIAQNLEKTLESSAQEEIAEIIKSLKTPKKGSWL
jgi:ankyrin repeat protein